MILWPRPLAITTSGSDWLREESEEPRGERDRIWAPDWLLGSCGNCARDALGEGVGWCQAFKVKPLQSTVRTAFERGPQIPEDAGRGRAALAQELCSRGISGWREVEPAWAGYPLARPAGRSGKLLRHAGGGPLDSGWIWRAVPTPPPHVGREPTPEGSMLLRPRHAALVLHSKSPSKPHGC